MTDDRPVDLRRLLGKVLAGAEAGRLEAALVERGGLPGARMNLGVVWTFARADLPGPVGRSQHGNGGRLAAARHRWAPAALT